MSKSPSYPPTASASLGPNPYAADTFPATGSSSRNMLSSKETDPSADEDAEAASETNQKVKKHWKDRGWDTALGEDHA